MDIIVGLPESDGYTKIWVIVDSFSKMAHYIPLPSLNKTKEMAKLLLTQVWKQHRLPEDIVSDKDSKFISHFWQSLMNLLSIKLNLSTAFHPQTERQTERVNQTLEAYMRNYCPISRITGQIFYHSPSMHTCLLSLRPPSFRHSMQTMVLSPGQTGLIPSLLRNGISP
jgi:hypothetical protein